MTTWCRPAATPSVTLGGGSTTVTRQSRQLGMGPRYGCRAYGSSRRERIGSGNYSSRFTPWQYFLAHPARIASSALKCGL